LRIHKPLKVSKASRIFCAVLMVSLLSLDARVSAADDNPKPIVVVISLDGFPAYALDDPRLPTPTLRRLMREGLFAKSMQTVNPTVTWPNHTTMITGVEPAQHGVIFNGLLTRPAPDVPPVVEPWRDKDLMVHAPTVYDAAHQAGLTTAQVDWVAIFNAKNIDWKFAEVPDPAGRIEKEMIADGTVTADQLKNFEDSSQAWQDEMWTTAAVKILQEHQPNLLLVHLLTLDDTNHHYGPMSEASFTAMALLDAQVGRVVDVLQRPEFAGRSTLLIVSDHGFKPISHAIHANVLLHDKKLVHGDGKYTRADAWVIADGGVAMVYVLDRAHHAELTADLRKSFATAEGIEAVYGAEDFPKLGLPTPDHSDQAPDLLLAAKDGYAFNSGQEKEYITPLPGGAHGYLNSDPKMRAIFLAWGRGVPTGARLVDISNLEVAPTIAALLNLKMQNLPRAPIKAISDQLQATTKK
jgi:predicted AlkP superfamily pyrophosphatase or phosphodiesterase